MSPLVVGVVLLLLVKDISGTSFSSLSTQQGGYQNVLLVIGDDVPNTDCASVLENVKSMIQDASRALHKATESRAYFGQVTILLSPQWSADPVCSVNAIKTPWPRRYKPDILVNQSHPVFGNQPFTLHHDGCGVASEQPIRLAVGSLPKGIDLIHEWFHYRYGVYDEIGVDQDPTYPSGYQIMSVDQESPSLLPTSCTNVPLNGQWIGSEWQNNNNNLDVTSSLMYTTGLLTIDRPCNETTHQKAPPTKQNWLCNGKSVTEIVREHEDFVKNVSQSTLVPTNITIATNPLRGYHFIIDVSVAMNSNGILFRYVKSAVSQFIWFLPNGLFVSIDTFADSNESIQLPVELNSTTKNNVMDIVANLQTSGQNSSLGLGPALDHAFQVFQTGMELILITAASTGDYADPADLYRSNLVGLRVLSLTEFTYHLINPLAYHGGNYFIPTAQIDGRSAQTWMTDTLHEIYSQIHQYRAKVHEVSLELFHGWNNGTFSVDSPGRVFFSFYNLDDSNGFYFIEGALYSPTGVRSTIGRPPKSFDLYQSTFTTDEYGMWSYSINAEITSKSYIRMDVRLESDSLLQMHTWISSPGKVLDWSLKPVTLFASVTSGSGQPVSGLALRVKVAGGDKESQIVLNEDNSADVTKGDGIYSAMLLNLPMQSTSFSCVIEMIDSTGTVDQGMYKGHPSAGSVIPANQPTTLSQRFYRYSYGVSFGLNRPYNGSDISPPGRVKDLRIVRFNTTQIELRWTAAKDNYGTSPSIVYKYRISGQCDQEEVRELFSGFIQPISGTVDQLSKTVEVPCGGLNYFHVYAIDDSGNQAQPSNTATVRTKKEPGSPVDPSDKGLPAWLFWLLIGLGCVCVALVVIITVICCCKKMEKKSDSQRGADFVQYGPDRSSAPKKSSLREPARSASVDEYSSSEWTDNDPSINDVEEVVAVTIERLNDRSYETRDSSSDETSSRRRSVAKRASPVPVPQQQRRVAPKPPPRRYVYSTPSLAVGDQRVTTTRGTELPLASSPAHFLRRFPTHSDLAQDDSSVISAHGSTLNQLRRLGILVEGDNHQMSLV